MLPNGVPPLAVWFPRQVLERALGLALAPAYAAMQSHDDKSSGKGAVKEGSGSHVMDWAGNVLSFMHFASAGFAS